MDSAELLKLVGVALGGGLTVKVLDIIYLELRRRSDTKRSATRFVDEHLDPLLKAADELFGKLRSLADEDFKTIRRVASENERLHHGDVRSLAFLIATFWASIEIIRREGLSVSIVKDQRGRRLQSFLDCIESRGVRIADRISQRAVGEAMIERRSDGSLDTIGFIDFVQLIENGHDKIRWLGPVMHTLTRVNHVADRQRLLRYGAVVHAMIDTLDPKHQVSRDRPAYSNKLSKKSWQELKYRLFERYLRFVRNPAKYLGPPKTRRPPKG